MATTSPFVVLGCLGAGILALLMILGFLCMKLRNSVGGNLEGPYSIQNGAIPLGLLRGVPLQVLREATSDFCTANILGRDETTTVYKGHINGNAVAIKRLNRGFGGGREALTAFQFELAVLSNINHMNLVSILGFCFEDEESILVYEYMPRGTLREYLFNRPRAPAAAPYLDWKTRVAVALDIARGLDYLHQMALPESLIHKGLNPSNILLGNQMNAKIGYFGFPRLASGAEDSSTHTGLAPECALTGCVTAKADVYSFGIILMQLITGRDATKPLGGDDFSAVEWFSRGLLKNVNFRQTIDPLIFLNESTYKSISTVAELASYCCRRNPRLRPDMRHVVNKLSSLLEVMSKPSYLLDELDDFPRFDDGMPLLLSVRTWINEAYGLMRSNVIIF